MSERRFKFVSPGIFIQEIDQSRRPRIPEKRGPVVIGRFERGPTMRPYQVQSFSEFLEVFGSPHPGGVGGDPWRNGNKSAPLYAAYAAQAYLRNNGPVNVLRLVGSPNDDATDTDDAKGGWSAATYDADTGGGAYGLFVATSGSDQITDACLAAVFYTADTNTHLALTGSVQGTGHTTSSIAVLVDSATTTPDFKMDIYTAKNTVDETITFNFDRDSDKFIRKVFNTNPTLTNADMASVSGYKRYWLGESFEQYVEAEVVTGTGNYFGVVLPLSSGSFNGANFRTTTGAQPGYSGWVVSQDTGPATSLVYENLPKLFRVIALDAGEWHQNNIKISITNIFPSRNQFDDHGTFSLVIRDIRDTDANVVVLERFDNLNLNPASPDFIGERIGTRYYDFLDSDGRLREYGKYANKSKYIRVELADELESGVGLDAALLPAGFHTETRYRDFTVKSGSLAEDQIYEFGSEETFFENAIVPGSHAGSDLVSIKYHPHTVDNDRRQVILFVNDADGGDDMRVDFRIPSASLRQTSNDKNLSSRDQAHFGIDTTRAGSTRAFDFSLRDILREKAGSAGGSSTYVSGDYLRQDIFTLDDLSGSLAGANNYHLVHLSGSRKSGTSATAMGVYKNNGGTNLLVSSSFTDLCNDNRAKFTMPLFGGSDGFDLTYREPLANKLMGTAATAQNNMVYNTYDRAISILGERELIDFNLVTAPGLTKTALTAKLLNTCEDRGDALAIIDLEGGYTPLHERNGGSAESANVGSVKTTIDLLKARGLNSSYGCAYYPWVLARDTASTGGSVWLPPSVVALGVMGSSETRSELWFAPAGFNRGGLSEEAAGIPVIDVRQRLDSTDRDDLYKNNVNPIASFPSEGIVVFGQKTLQVTPSALDRINVRRLMIYLKKEISIAASRILFDQNVQETWKRFIGQVRPLLKTVQARFGITDFKLVLDETTTTPDLVDRNILYAKVFVKPARAIEYIAVDFFITSTGASFEE